MWTDENRARYDRSKLRYPSDLTDGEWELVRPCIPSCTPGLDLLRELRARERWASLPVIVVTQRGGVATARAGWS